LLERPEGDDDGDEQRNHQDEREQNPFLGTHKPVFLSERYASSQWQW
jgi:hypothetical protein